MREFSNEEIDKGLPEDVSEQRFDLQKQSAVVLLKDNKSEHGIVGEFLQQCTREGSQAIQIQGHSVAQAKQGKYTVKSQQDLNNLYCYTKDESLLYNVSPSAFSKH